MGIRDNRYDAMVPQVVGPLRLAGRVHASEARLARAHTTSKLKFTLPGPMTIVDTVADRYYGDGRKAHQDGDARSPSCSTRRRARSRPTASTSIQFDEPAFNVYMADAAEWGVAALERAPQGLKCKTAVHICYGYGIKANVDWKETLGGEWRQYEQIFPALAKSRIDQVSLECIHSHVPAELMRLLDGKDVMVGVIDVASDVIETPEEVAETIGERAAATCRSERLFPCTNCGLAPMRREVAEAKLAALAQRRGAGAASATADERGRAAARRRRRSSGSPTALAEQRPRRPRAGRLRALRGAPRSPSSTRCRPSWDALPPDAHLRDGGRYRRRRHASFVVDERRGPPRRAARALAAGRIQRPARRPRALVRADRAGVIAGAGVAAHAAVVRLATASRLSGAQPWYVEAHQFRIDTHRRHRPADARGRASRRRRLRRRRPGRPRRDQGRRDARLRRRRPGRACASRCSSRGRRSLLDDARVIHESTPIQPLEGYGHRDTLVLTYRAGAFQGPPGVHRTGTPRSHR